jgi:DNA-binding NarL/FixJ family response regulator
MRELVLATISEKPDIEVIREIREDPEIAHVVGRSQPDFMMIALDRADEHPTLCANQFRRHPRMKILALAPKCNRSIFFWPVLGIRSARIENSEEGTLSALPGKAHVIAQ